MWSDSLVLCGKLFNNPVQIGLYQSTQPLTLISLSVFLPLSRYPRPRLNSHYMWTSVRPLYRPKTQHNPRLVFASMWLVITPPPEPPILPQPLANFITLRQDLFQLTCRVVGAIKGVITYSTRPSATRIKSQCTWLAPYTTLVIAREMTLSSGLGMKFANSDGTIHHFTYSQHIWFNICPGTTVIKITPALHLHTHCCTNDARVTVQSTRHSGSEPTKVSWPRFRHPCFITSLAVLIGYSTSLDYHVLEQFFIRAVAHNQSRTGESRPKTPLLDLGSLLLDRFQLCRWPFPWHKWPTYHRAPLENMLIRRRNSFLRLWKDIH